MTTPATMGKIIADLRKAHTLANHRARVSYRKDPAGYEHGYDLGTADTLRSLIEEITGEYIDPVDVDA